MTHKVLLTLVLVGFWLILSGHYTPLLLSLGAVSVGLVVFLAARMHVIETEVQSLALFPRIFPYWLWLLKKIALANIDVFTRVWRGKQSIAPTRITYKCHASTDLGKTVFANSVTLTPGTIALDVHGDQVEIHALTPQHLRGLKAVDEQLQKVEPS